MRKDEQKIIIKIRRGKGWDWAHFCYVPIEAKERFDKALNPEHKGAKFWVEKWAKEYGFKQTTIDNQADLDALKDEIKALYKNLYPDLYRDNYADRQGWMRVWFNSNMEMELKLVGK